MEIREFKSPDVRDDERFIPCPGIPENYQDYEHCVIKSKDPIPDDELCRRGYELIKSGYIVEPVDHEWPYYAELLIPKGYNVERVRRDIIDLTKTDTGSRLSVSI